LWTLDHGNRRGQPRLPPRSAQRALLQHYDFRRGGGLLSMLNDFQVDPAGEHIYIAERPDAARRSSSTTSGPHEPPPA
jgi:hypothetical protein